MKKVFLFLCLGFLFLMAGCTGKTTDLTKTRKSAIDEVSTYVLESDYSVSDYNTIITIIANAKTEINEAKNKADIEKIVAKAKSDIDKVPVYQEDETLTREKENLVLELEKFGDESEYSQAKWQEILELIDLKSAEIMAALTLNQANQIYLNSLEALQLIENKHTEYANLRLASLNIPKETDENFDLIETEVDSNYVVVWSVVQGTAISIGDGEAVVLRAFENVDVIIKVDFLKDQKVVYSKDFFITILAKSQESVNVSTINDLLVGETIILKGIVVGVASNGNTGGQEVIIKDLVTSDYVGVRSIPGTYPNYTVSKGDIIEFIGVINQGTLTGDVNKKYVRFESDLKIISSDNVIDYDLDHAKEIADQDALIELITNAEVYQLVKFTTSIYTNKYGSTYETYYNRFTLDSNNTTYNSIKIDGIPPALQNSMTSYNIGEGWTDVMFGINSSNFAGVSTGYPGYEYDGEVYAMFIGGNDYYYQFVIFENSHIIPTVVKEAKLQAVVDLNAYLDTFDENIYSAENWILLNGSILEAGIKAINESITVSEVQLALLEAKTNMNNVEKAIVTVYVEEFTLPNKTEYYTQDELDLIGGKIVIKVDGEVVHEKDLTPDMITGFDSSVAVSEQVITITVAYGGKTFTTTYTIEVLNRPASNVSDVKDLEVGIVAKFTGLVIGTAANGNTGGNEVIIKDLNTFEYIGIRAMPGTYPVFTVSKGDIIEFVASVSQSAAPGDMNKKLLTFSSDLVIVSSDNEVVYDLANAIKIEDQNALVNFINEEIAYRFIKITTNIYSNKYGTTYETYYNRFTLDPNNKSFASIKVNDLSLALNNRYSSSNIGEGWTDLMFGLNENNVPDVSTGYPGFEFEGELYTMLIGGNSYYYQFIIFENGHIIPMPGKNLSLAKEAAIVELEEYLKDFLESDYTEENWLLLNGSVLNNGKIAINESETIAEVDSALLEAKNNLDAVDRIVPIVYEEEFTLPNKTEYFIDEELDLTGGKIVIKVDGEIVHEKDLTPDMITGFDNSEVNEALTLTITVVYGGETFTTSYIIKVIERPLVNVSDISSLEVGDIGRFTGLVIGTAGNGNAAGGEVVIKDLTTFEYIGIRTIPGDYPDYDVKKGDIIEFVGSVITSTAGGDGGKKLLNYTSDLKIISSDNDVVYDLENVLVIEKHQDLVDFINSNQAYKIIKITSSIYSNKYGSVYDSYYNRFTLDGNNKTYESIKINGIPPAFRNNFSANNIGDGWTDLMFGINDTNFVDIVGSYPGIEFEGELYTMFVGGNAYYYQFIIFENSHIIPMPGKKLNLAKQSAILELDEYLEGFLESDYTEENWLLLNGSVLDNGKLAINSAEDLTEVDAALLEAKNNLDAVTRIVPVVYTNELIVPLITDYYLDESLNLTGGKFIVKADGVVVFEEDLTLDMISGFDSSELDESLTVTVTVIYAGETFIQTFTVKVVERTIINVSEVKDLDLGNIVRVTGLVIGTAANGNTGGNEVIIKDLNTFEYIGIRAMPGTYPEFTVSKGDIIDFVASVITSTAVGDLDKKLLSYNSRLVTVSTNNEVTYYLENALLVENQNDIVDLINDKHVYKFIKITANIYSNKYGTTYETYYNRFTLDPANTSLAAIRVNGLTLALNNRYSTSNIGDGWTDVMFGINADNLADITGSYPGIEFEGEVYVMLIGGNAYYYQFIIFENSHITPMPGKNLNLAKEAALLELAEYLEGFLESDYTEANWLLLNGDVYNGGKDGINAAEDLTEVAAALLQAKTNLNNVEKLVPQLEVISVLIETMPTKLIYGHREGVNDIDLTGGELKVTYSDNSFTVIDMATEMLPTEESVDWKIGQVSYNLTYEEKTVQLTVTYENQAISVSEFKEKTSGTYDVTGLVVGPMGSAAAIELLIMDVATQEIIGILNSGVVGATAAPLLDTSVLNVGDKIIVSLVVVKTTSGANIDRVSGNGTNATTFKGNLIIESSNHDVVHNLAETNVTVISTQEELVEFLNNPNRFYSYVKLVGVKAIVYSLSYRIFFDENINSLATQKVKVDTADSSPFINGANCDAYLTESYRNFFENSESTSYANPATTNYDIYALYIGGNTYYYNFCIMDDSWFVSSVPAE